MVILFSHSLYFLIVFQIPFLSFADQRIDYDIDDDGLIEINTLQDLHEIRNNVSDGDYPEIKGDRLYGSNDGCPINGCNGYELTADLDFDTNGNGRFDEQDLFWNEGEGWQPIGSFSLKFNSEFNGNGFALKNFVMRRPGHVFAGLFSYAEFGYFHDFTLTADFITGGESGGVLAYGWNTRLEDIDVSIVIKGEDTPQPCSSKCVPQIIGGVVGSLDESVLKKLMVKSEVDGLERLGGVAGDLYNSELSEIAVNTEIQGVDQLGGLSGTISGSSVQSIAAFSNIRGGNIVAGLVGGSDDSTFTNILVSGLLTPAIDLERYARSGGLIASASSSDEITNVISLVQLPEDAEDKHFIGAIVGDAGRLTSSNVFWANDLANRSTFFHDSRNNNLGQVWDLNDLQCADESNDCNGLQFDGFSSATNSNGASLWGFGTVDEAPSLTLPMGSFSDKDGNGVVDEWPGLNPSNQSKDNGGGMMSRLCLALVFGLLLFRRRLAY